MKNKFHQAVSIVLILAILMTLVPPIQAFAATQLPDKSMDEAFLLMITANARLLEDASGLPADAFVRTGSGIARQVGQPAQKQVNEQRLLARYYLDLARRLPADSSQVKTFLSKAYAHDEMAGILQRRRDRANNPLQKIGRVITTPFKFIAREVVKLVRQGIKLLDEVGPEIIYDMIQGYLTTGTPINAKIFFQKFKDIAMERIKNSLANKAAAIAMGVPSKPPSTGKPKMTATISRLMQTMTARAAPVKTETVETEIAETEIVPKKYGAQTISVGIDNISDWAVVSRDYFAPMITARTECGYKDFQAWEPEKIVMPIRIDLDKGTFTAQITGSGTDYLEANEITIPAWEFTAAFNGEISDGTIIAKEDLSGWVMEGTVQMRIVPGGEMRCLRYPLGYPEVPAEYVWLKTTLPVVVEHAFHGEINQEKTVKDGKSFISPGGKLTFDIGLVEAEEDVGSYFFLYVSDMSIPSAFPPP